MGTWRSAAGEVEFLWLPRDPELAHAALVTHSSNKRQGAAINMPPAHTLPDWSRDTLHELVKGDKGFTMRDYLGDGPQSGYMVSVDPHESETFPLHDVQHHPEWIGDYFDRHQTHLDQDPSLHVGAWVNQGKVYLDLSKHVDSAEKAEVLSEKHHQKAYFDLDSGVGIIPQYRQPKTGKYAGQRVGFFRNRTSLIDQVTAATGDQDR